MEAANGTPLDIALGAVPFEENCVQRASAFNLGTGCVLTVCSAEDLLVHKVVANRGQDWLDIEGILARQWGKLDLSLFRKEVQPLLELREALDCLDRFDRLLHRIRRRLWPGELGD